MATSQKFGGNWTEDKLNIFTSYLDAYLIALQNQEFKKIYIDAFAGTGEIETSDGGQYLVGSAKRALSADKKFDRYFFIEKDEDKAAELWAMVDSEFPELKRSVSVYCGDANEKLEQIIREQEWRYNRGLLFLDPYATQVNWTTLETVAKTKSIDVWYLFPFSALERMLPKNGKYEKWEDNINRLLGDTGWREEFYKKDPQMTLFDLFPDASDQNDGERKVKDANPDQIKEYILSRLETIFPCVSKHARIFRNSRNSPMFLFCFAISSDNPKAKGLALRIADNILKKK
ncbi:MAG: three-Cys-motif partner protein TcmP [Chloroflexi bacterium]|nr:three-Cys-motif partner protein TcmP [Chloroflexota bacterium]